MKVYGIFIFQMWEYKNACWNVSNIFERGIWNEWSNQKSGNYIFIGLKVVGDN